VLTSSSKQFFLNLKPFEIFDYYDGPKFYSCKDVIGQLFLVYWIDQDEQSYSWIYFRVSVQRYNSIKRGDISIAKSIENPEDSTLYIVKTKADDIIDIEEIGQHQIDPEWLPSPDDFLNISTPSLPEKITTTVDLARQTYRQVLDIAFNKLNNSYEMGCGKLGKLLESIQSSIYSLACNETINIKKIPDGVKFNNELLVTGLFASSFGLRLQTRGGNLFGDNKSEKAMDLFIRLIEKINEPEELKIELHNCNILTRSRFKQFLRAMCEAEVSVKTDLGTPEGYSATAAASFDNIIKALASLDQNDAPLVELIKVAGNLVGVDVKSDFFALVVDGDDLIKGKLSAALRNEHFEVPSRVTATIQQKCVFDPLIEQEKWTYTLTEISKQV